MISLSSRATFRNPYICGALALFFVFTILGVMSAQWNVVIISWIAFGAMAGAIPLGMYRPKPHQTNQLIAGYGLSAGAMITSAAIFLIPAAVKHNVVFGGLGIAIGILTGYTFELLNAALARRSEGRAVSPVMVELSMHALAAGFVIGFLYATATRLSIVLGLAIISHKGPAGYAAARKLTTERRNPLLLLIPASAIGLTALPVGLMHIYLSPLTSSLVFGFATGIFLHIGMGFLPGVKSLDENEKSTWASRRQLWAASTTFAGGLIVFLLFLLIQ